MPSPRRPTLIKRQGRVNEKEGERRQAAQASKDRRGSHHHRQEKGLRVVGPESNRYISCTLFANYSSWTFFSPLFFFVSVTSPELYLRTVCCTTILSSHLLPQQSPNLKPSHCHSPSLSLTLPSNAHICFTTSGCTSHWRTDLASQLCLSIHPSGTTALSCIPPFEPRPLRLSHPSPTSPAACMANPHAQTCLAAELLSISGMHRLAFSPGNREAEILWRRLFAGASWQ